MCGLDTAALRSSRRLVSAFESGRRDDLPENQDLEKAITRSALLADLFCRPRVSTKELVRRLGAMWLRFGARLSRPDGIFHQDDGDRIRPAVRATRERLGALERGDFTPVGIDAAILIKAHSGEQGRELAATALEAVEREHKTMPDAVRRAHGDRWFGYLCLTFHEAIKSDARLSRIFAALQSATGFEHLEHVVRDEAAVTRQMARALHAETWRKLDVIDQRVASRIDRDLDERRETLTDNRADIPRSILRISSIHRPPRSSSSTARL